MRRKGINYDVAARPGWDPTIVRGELTVIARDLHCTAVRISGGELGRLEFATSCALDLGLEVWLSPVLVDADRETTTKHVLDCARLAERLRGAERSIVLVVGCELTVFMAGLVLGATSDERMIALTKPWRLLETTIRLGPYNRNLDRFLGKLVTEVRRVFGGPVTYASGLWERVAWSRFDFVAVDYFLDASTRRTYRERLRGYAAHGKPVVITEFGCCTYVGAEDKGGHGWAIVDHTQTPPRLIGMHTRSEGAQARTINEALEVFESEPVVDGAFVFTFVTPTYPHVPDPHFDLDMASYGLVTSYADRHGTTYPAMPWEPKEAFRVVAEHFGATTA